MSKRVVLYGLLILLAAIQYPLWIGKGGWLHAYDLDKKVQAQSEKNRQLELRNAKLEGEVNDLKDGTRAIEERARTEHGMVKESETMVQIVQNDEELPKPITKPKAEKKEEAPKDNPSSNAHKSTKSKSSEVRSQDKTSNPDKVAQ